LLSVALYNSVPLEPTDLGFGSFRFVPIAGFDGIVTSRVEEVVFHFDAGETRRVDLIPGPEGVDANYFVLFAPDGIGATVEARSADGHVLRSLKVTTPPPPRG
jgi:hypothetical protein